MEEGLRACWDEDWGKAELIAKTPGAKLDEVDAELWSMMHHAVWHSRKELLGALLSAGANPSLKDGEGLTPGILACAKTRWELASTIASHERGLDAQDQDGWAMLHYAAANGQADLTSTLLAKGADAALVDKESLTPGLAACAKEQWNTALILAEHGKALGAQDEDGWSMAHYAVDNGQREILASLIKGGAPLNLSTSDSMTPAALALADPASHWALPELIKAGARVEASALLHAGLGADGAAAASAPHRVARR